MRRKNCFPSCQISILNISLVDTIGTRIDNRLVPFKLLQLESELAQHAQ